MSTEEQPTTAAPQPEQQEDQPPTEEATAPPVEDEVTPARDTTDPNSPQSPIVQNDDGSIMQSHVRRGYRNSETRTPLIVFLSDGDPYPSINTLAKEHGCCVWTITMDSERAEQNALDYVDVGIQNGDWVYLKNSENASTDVLRRIGTILMTLEPSPKQFPRRGLFRCWFALEEPFNVNDQIKPVLPHVIMKHALVCRAAKTPGTGGPASPEKIQRRLPAEPPVLETEVKKHMRRRDEGRESDSESDTEEPEQKPTGMWFHRAVDFYTQDNTSTLARANEVIFEAVEREDSKLIEELSASGHINIDRVKKDGMNPLMLAVSLERPVSVKALLAAGADPTVKRESDGSPLLFMCIEDESILNALVEAGADYHQKFQGYRLEDHPTTPPHIASLVKQLKGYNQKQ